MRRLDAVLLLAVSAFAVFVGAQVVRVSGTRAALHKQVVVASPTRTDPGGPRVIQQSVAVTSSDSLELSTTIVASKLPAPVRNEEDIRSRIGSAAIFRCASTLSSIRRQPTFVCYGPTGFHPKRDSVSALRGARAISMAGSPRRRYSSRFMTAAAP